MRRPFRSTSIVIGGAVLAVTVASAARLTAGQPGPLRAAYRTHEVTIPAGTVMRMRLAHSVGSDLSRPEDPVTATLASPVTYRGITVLPAGSTAHGYVTTAHRSGKVKGRGRLGMRFTRIVTAGDHEQYNVATRTWFAVAPATKRKDALKIGAPAAGGAVVGALVGGKKGAGIGALIGGGTGTAVVLSTRGKEVRVGRGATLSVRLGAPLTVRVPA